MVETFRTGWIASVVGLAVGMAFALAFTGFGLWLVVGVPIVHPDAGALPTLIVVLIGAGVCALGVVGVHSLLTTCFLVRVWDNGTCEFRSVLHRTRVHALEIVSITGVRDSYGNVGDAKIVTRRGKLRFDEPFDGFEPFLARLKELNANITVSFPSGFLKDPETVAARRRRRGS